MPSLRHLSIVCISGLVACSSAQGVGARFPGPMASSPLKALAPVTFAAAMDVLPPPRRVTTLSAAVALYEAGEAPPSSLAMIALYRQVCSDPDRTRARRSAYDRGDEVARRQDCYCADEIPCSENRDCTDLIACHPQVALSDAEDTRSSSL